MTEQGANGGRPERAANADEPGTSTAPDPDQPTPTSGSGRDEKPADEGPEARSGDETPRAASNGTPEVTSERPADRSPKTSSDAGHGARPGATVTSPAPGSTRQATETDKTRAERLRAAGSTVKKGTDALRNRIASVVWLVAVVCAVILALGALLISLEANPDNSLVVWVTDAAKRLDGPFANVFQFDGDNARTKERLVNWGLAALAYLIVGRVLDRIIRA